jgi:UDP-2,3-diacylglucosamine pyrophosphatase LpxH
MQPGVALVIIRDWAVGTLRERPELQLIVAGHAHYPELLEVEAGRFYANAGDWIHNFTYLSLPGGAPLRS